MTKHHSASIARRIGGDAVASAFGLLRRGIQPPPLSELRGGRVAPPRDNPSADRRAHSERGGWDGQVAADAETVEHRHDRLDRERVVPAALTRPCPDHDAAVGEACFSTSGVSGICGSRLILALRQGGAS